MRKLYTAHDLIKPIEDAIRTGNRINCNSYVGTLIKKHNFVQKGKSIYGTLENVIKTVQQEFIVNFTDGYTRSAITDENSIVVYEVANIKSTATSLKKQMFLKDQKSQPQIKFQANKTKHDYIEEHIRNTDIGELGENWLLKWKRKS